MDGQNVLHVVTIFQYRKSVNKNLGFDSKNCLYREAQHIMQR